MLHVPVFRQTRGWPIPQVHSLFRESKICDRQVKFFQQSPQDVSPPTEDTVRGTRVPPIAHGLDTISHYKPIKSSGDGTGTCSREMTTNAKGADWMDRLAMTSPRAPRAYTPSSSNESLSNMRGGTSGVDCESSIGACGGDSGEEFGSCLQPAAHREISLSPRSQESLADKRCVFQIDNHVVGSPPYNSPIGRYNAGANVSALRLPQ